MTAAPLGPILAFVHLPRTAGTAIREAMLLPAFDPEETFFVEETRAIAPHRRAARTADIAALPAATRRRLRLVAGHMPFGLEPLFGDRPVHYLTFVRDPVERALSVYFYCRAAADNPAHPLARSLSPGEFAEAGYGGARDGMTRYLSNAVWGVRYPSEEAMLAAAEAALARCMFIGLYERLDDDIRALRALLRLAEAPLPRVNECPRDPPVTEDDRNRVAAANRLDAALYRRAMALRAVVTPLEPPTGGA